MPIWEQNIITISKITGNYPKEIYASVVRAIQLEYIFVQHSTRDMGYTFEGIEKLLRENFLLHLFFINLNLSHPS